MATKIYNHECNNTTMRRNFGDVSLSCQMSRRTPSLKRGGAGSTRRTAQRDTFFAPTTAHLFACKSPANRLQIMSDYFKIEARLQEALQYKREHPESSFRWLNRQFRVHKDRIHRRWKGTQQSRFTRNPTTLKLDKYQDKAFYWYLTRLWEIRVLLR